MSTRLRQYLLLVRLPNVFTAPSNVMVGYFATVSPAASSGFQLAALMLSSGLLYIAGIVLNDYFDIEVDMRERPSRPLPSGRVPKRHAAAIAIAALAAANAIAVLAGPTSLVVSLALSCAIFAYDYWLKHTSAAPIAMGTTRFLNVILGASPAIPLALVGINPSSLGTAVFGAASLFGYVVAIMMLSKKEVKNERPGFAAFSVVFAIIASIASIGLMLNMQLVFLINLSIFAIVNTITFKHYIMTEAPSVQKAIRNMVISIILLDSVFVAGVAGLPYGLATMLFILPAVTLARKLYVT